MFEVNFTAIRLLTNPASCPQYGRLSVYRVDHNIEDMMVQPDSMIEDATYAQQTNEYDCVSSILEG